MVEHSSEEHFFKAECCCCGSFEQGQSDELLVKFNQLVHVFLKPCIYLLGLQVFNWRVVDCDLAIGLCTILPRADVFKILWKVIDNTWQNYDKILVGNKKISYSIPALQYTISSLVIPFHFFQAVAKIGSTLCCLYDEVDEQKKFLSVITDAEWGIKLGKLEVCE